REHVALLQLRRRRILADARREPLRRVLEIAAPQGQAGALPLLPLDCSDEQLGVRPGPLEIRVERARQLRERLVAIVAVATPDPVELPQPFRRGGRVGAVAGERHDPLAALLRTPQLEEAVLGRGRALADDEDDALGGVDPVVDVLRSLLRWRDVYPVDPA